MYTGSTAIVNQLLQLAYQLCFLSHIPCPVADPLVADPLAEVAPELSVGASVGKTQAEGTTGSFSW